MKIRLEFVTNSSSSSFTCVALYSEELYEYLQKLIGEKSMSINPNGVGYLQEIASNSVGEQLTLF